MGRDGLKMSLRRAKWRFFSQSSAEFFGLAELPNPDVPKAILETISFATA
jgi:hypothetical protein